MLGSPNSTIATAFTPSFSSAKTADQDLLKDLYALSDNKINALDLPAILAIVSKHQFLLDKVFESIYLEEFNKEDLLILARKNTTFASEVAEGEVELDVTLEELCTLGLYQSEVALYLLDNKAFSDELSSEQLVQLGRAHASIALEILKRQDLLDKLKSVEIAEMTKNHFGLIDTVILTLEDKLDLTARCILIANYPALNRKTFEENRANLTGKELAILSTDFDTATKVLSDPDLYNRLTVEDWIAIGQQHHLLPEIQKIRTLSLEDFVQMAAYQEESARYLIKTFRTVLSGPQLATICKRHPKLSLEVIGNPLYSKKLEDAELRTLGAQSEETALAIVNNPALRAKIEGSTLAFLGSKHYKVARKIYTDINIGSKLQPSDYNILARAQIGSMRAIATFTDVREHLTEETLEIMDHNIKLAEKIQKIAEDLINPLLEGALERFQAGLVEHSTAIVKVEPAEKATKAPRL